MDLPLKEVDIIVYVGWLIVRRKVKAATINGYLSGLRQLHTVNGAEPPEIRTSLVKSILRGQTNIDNIKKRQGDSQKRLPMTMSIMRQLKEEIRTSTENPKFKLLLWAICTLAFHGAFRIHELLCTTESTFDPDFNLLGNDVSVRQEFKEGGEKFLEVKLKCPKESKVGNITIIDVFETKGSICPVKAFTKWRQHTNIDDRQPLFRKEDGTPMTGTKLNKWLKDKLGKYIDYGKEKYTSHSFRIGLATTLGVKGCSNKDIKEAGRWNSNTYKIYMRLPRNRREEIAKKIGKLTN